jgi:uncharacterized phage protein (TIGR01671 family)
MNRPIRFRAWCPETKKMSKPFDLEWLKETTPVPDNFNKEAVFKDNLIFMQFTGLHDSKGKEIWEGDVVQGDWHSHSLMGDKKFKIGVVEFKAPSFWVNGKKSEGACRCSDLAELNLEDEEIEVIGNRWMNPELLKEGE